MTESVRDNEPAPPVGLTRRSLRVLWRYLPARFRYRLYDNLVHSDHWFFRSIRGMVMASRMVTLRYHRAMAKEVWPDVGGLDHLALAVWGAFLRLHRPAMALAWSHGHRVRAWRRRVAADAVPGSVLHVTGSFDIGGTQIQVRHLCTAAQTQFRHEAIEIFPEFNYLYRRGVAVEPADYEGRGVIGRTAARLVVNANYRSSQLVQIYKLYRDFRRLRPEVVVGWGHEMSVTAFIAASFARVPTIVFCIRTVNPGYLWVPKYFGDLLRAAHQRMLPFVKVVMVNSTLLKADHAEWVGMDPAGIAVCANGIAFEPVPAEARAEARARVRAAHGIDPDAVVIANVGRFSQEKGQASIIEANRILLAAGGLPKFVWLLCGDGPTLPEIRAQAESLGMTNVRFPGRTTAVREVLSASDLFVMPSDFEGMPNAMMEAMAAGVACISTTVSGARDVARDGVEALYYEPRDAAALARHVRTLLADPTRAAELGAAGARRVTEFSVERFVREFETALGDSERSPAGTERPSPQPSPAPHRRGIRRFAVAIGWRVRAALWDTHDFGRRIAWLHGHRIRRWRTGGRERAVPGTVLHVTGSFDIGGTATQITHLCTATHTRFRHVAVEIFPERNLLYRQHVTLDRSKYGFGPRRGRRVAEVVADPNRRSLQVVQIYKLVRDFRAERPEVVVGWDHEMSVAAFVAAAIVGVPHIVFCIRTLNPSSGWADPPFPELLLGAHRRMARWVSRVVANSSLVQRDHAAWAAMLPSRIAVCPSGVSLDPLPVAAASDARAAVRARHGIAADAVLIVTLGRFVWGKGQLSLIEPARLLNARGVPVVWLLVGDGPTLPAVKAKAASMGISNMIFAERTLEVREILSAGDIFVMPSDYEGLPNAMMEAMQAGLPCVSTDRTGALDVARDGIEALYYRPGDSLQLANHILRLVEEPSAARALGEAARARMREFTVPRFVRAFEDVIDEIAPARGSA